MARQRFRKPPMSQINVVPYIDVMLVLLIIFMVTAPLLTQGIVVELPKAASEPIPDEQEEPLVVSVDRKGAYYLNIGGSPDTPIDGRTLVARVAAVLRQRPEARVLVKGDAQVAYAAVVGAMSLLQQAGARGIGLLTESADVEPSGN